jgi:hypothetical protein
MGWGAIPNSIAGRNFIPEVAGLGIFYSQRCEGIDLYWISLNSGIRGLALFPALLEYERTMI